MKDKRAAEALTSLNQAQSNRPHANQHENAIDTWRKERNQELIRDAHALSAFANQSKMALSKSRQAWLEQREKYESNVLYEARRQLALLQHDSQAKESAGSTNPQQQVSITGSNRTAESQPHPEPAPTTAVSAHRPSPTQTTVGQKHPLSGRGRESSCLAHETPSASPDDPATAAPPTGAAVLPENVDTLDGLGKSIARIEELMKQYTKPLTGSLSVSSPSRTIGSGGSPNQCHVPLNVYGANRKPAMDRLHSKGPRLSLRLSSGSAAQQASASVTGGHGWDPQHQSSVAAEKGSVEAAEPLASTWANLGELVSHDLISLAATHRSR